MSGNAESMNFTVGAIGDTQREPCNFNILTLEKMCRWIDRQPSIDDDVKEELKKKAGTYPQTALMSFKNNFKTHLAKSQKIVRDRTPLKEIEDHFSGDE